MVDGTIRSSNRSRHILNWDDNLARRERDRSATVPLNQFCHRLSAMIQFLMLFRKGRPVTDGYCVQNSGEEKRPIRQQSYAGIAQLIYFIEVPHSLHYIRIRTGLR
jgi:hypothetical protein